MIHRLLPLIISLILLSALSACKNKHAGSEPDSSNPTQAELAKLNEAIANDSKNPEHYLNRAHYYMGQELLNNAMNDISTALKLNPKFVKSYASLASVYLMMGKPQQSLDALNQGLKIESNNVALLVQESRLYLIMKDYEGCAATVEQILGIEPSNSDALYIKGMALMENDKMDLAIESFRMVILNNQKHYDALMQLGFIYEDRDPKIAIEYFKSATLARPESIEALYNLALLYQENMEPDKAIQSYESIIKLDSTYKEAYYNIGYVNLVYREKFHDGIEYFNKAIKLDSVYSDAYFNRGYCYELLKMKTEARRDYQKVLSLNTNDQKAVDGMNRLDKLK